MGNYKFDLDFPEGEFAERLVMGLLSGERGPIEVKRDWIVSKTGNLAIEYKCRGKASGLGTTEATWWALVLDGDKFAHEMIIFIKTSRLREIAQKIYSKNGAKNGGDDNASRMILIPIEEFIHYRPKTTSPALL